MQQKREKVTKFCESVLSKYGGVSNIKQLNFELGIDEAGRGPVFGTMVYSALWWPIELREELSSLGFDDSKQLAEEKREELLMLLDILKEKVVFYETREIGAREISTNMNNNKYNINLNEMSHNAALELVKRAFAQGFKITEIYADTVGDPVKYTAFMALNLKEHNQTIQKIVIQPKADSKFKVVSASSICAKVNRDRIIREWKFQQNIEYKGELGSGYPSDPKTKQWLQTNKHPVFGFPSIVRFSWSTASNALSQVLQMKVSESAEKQQNLKKLEYMCKNKKEMNYDLWDLVGDA